MAYLTTSLGRMVKSTYDDTSSKWYNDGVKFDLLEGNQYINDEVILEITADNDSFKIYQDEQLLYTYDHIVPWCEFNTVKTNPPFKVLKVTKNKKWYDEWNNSNWNNDSRDNELHKRMFPDLYWNSYYGNDLNEASFLKTEFVPSVSQNCPMCSNNGGVCMNCGGNGGSGCSSNQKTYKDSFGNVYVLETDRNGVEKYVMLTGHPGPVSNLVNQTGNTISNVADSTGKTITGVADSTGKTITGVANSAVVGGSNLANTAGNTVTGLANSAVNAGSNIVNTAGGILNTAATGVGNAFNTTANLAGGIVGTTANLAGGIVGTAAGLAKDTGSGVYNIMKNNNNSTGNVQNQGVVPSGQLPALSPLTNTASALKSTPVDNYSYYGALQSKGGAYMPITADFSSFRK
jgi:hypothetical protein